MKVTVKLFATLADCLPPGTKGNAVTLEVADSACVGPTLAQFRLPAALTHLVLVNGTYVAREARPDWRLKDGDHLAVWPPIAGG
jgi:molybdopterin converting factor small subunit